uniref:Tyrosine-protein phosphatase domain-containing protein n=1 Tax=Panagrellus redivivus TaxID=6233 RepID=A0A7E4ZPU6_PANRE
MNEREPSTLDKILGRTPTAIRRPTLSGFLSAAAEAEMKEQQNKLRNRSCPPGQSFRFKSIYRGKIRSRSSNDVLDEPEPLQNGVLRQISNASQVLQRGGAKVANLARSASRMARDLAARGRSGGKTVRKFTAPSSKTLEHFDKTFMISEIMATGASQQQMETEVRICCIIQVRVWPIENKVPLSTASLIEVIKMTRSWRRRAPDRPETKPTIVMSHNGYSRCGIFIGANVCIDQMDMDHEVDVFHAVKMIRINRPQLIDMKDEYKYLYDLMLHWYMTNPEYRIHDVDDVVEDTNGNDTHLSNGSAFNSNRPSIKSIRRRSGSPLKRSIGPGLPPAAPLPLTNHI